MDNAYASMREEKKLRHADWKEKNTKILQAGGLDIVFTDEWSNTAILREEDKPKIDFYLTTGRWKNVARDKIYSGGAQKFLQWYKEQ